MRWPVITLLLWLLVGWANSGVMADEVSPVGAANKTAQESGPHNRDVVPQTHEEKTSTVKEPAVQASPSTASASAATVNKKTNKQPKPSATRKAKTGKKPGSVSAKKTSAPVTLNLHLPSTALPDASDALQLVKDPHVPNFFEEKQERGRVSVDGKFLFEEDVELHPGAGSDRVSKDQTEQQNQQSWLEGVEGEELRLRVHTD